MNSYRVYEKQMLWNWCDKIVIAIFGVFGGAIWFYSGILQEAQRNPNHLSAEKYWMHTIMIALLFTIFFLVDYVIAKCFYKKLAW